MKKALLLLIVGSQCAFGQDLYMKIVSEASGMPFASMANVTAELYYSSGKSKSVTKAQGQNQVMYTVGKQMTIVNSDLCGSFPTEDYWKEDISRTANTRITKLEKTEETREIHGYTCKMVRMTVESSRNGVAISSEMIGWFAPDLKKYSVSGYYEGADEYSKALAELGGMLESETNASGIIVRTKVTEIKTDALPSNTFEVKGCKKPLNAADYNKEMKKRERRASTGFY
jgi:hypothetical protein